MQLALRLCFCLMPIASISTTSQKFRNAVVVSHVKIHPNRRSGDTTTPHRRMEPERRFPPLPRCKTLTVEEGGRSYWITSLGSPRGVSHHPKLCHWHHLKTDLSSRRLSPSLRCPPVRPDCSHSSLVESHVP